MWFSALLLLANSRPHFLLDTAGFFSQLVILSFCSITFLRTLVASPKLDKRSCAIQKVRCIAFGHGAPHSHGCGTGVLRSPNVRCKYLSRSFSFSFYCSEAVGICLSRSFSFFLSFLFRTFSPSPELPVHVPAWRTYLHPIKFPPNARGVSVYNVVILFLCNITYATCLPLKRVTRVLLSKSGRLHPLFVSRSGPVATTPAARTADFCGTPIMYPSWLWIEIRLPTVNAILRR